MKITNRSLEVFLSYANDAGNWGGTPLVSGDKSERGNLTQLKRAGLITTFEDEGCMFIAFTYAGGDLALEHGIRIDTP